MINRATIVVICSFLATSSALALQAAPAVKVTPAVPIVPAVAAAPTEPAPDGLLDQDDVLEDAAEITAAKYPDAKSVLVGEYVRTEYQADGSHVTFDDEYVKVLTEEGRQGAREKQFSYNAFYGGDENYCR